ncbi:uncharacterized protein LOC134182894 isoform X1 [Corticium candelabrum]|uniref:uncharacterized protein LOC134182894 isoform X1 n=1 Tax=Corticium candelabrum TaxID=121492 RepID=UPI002E268678|nr:uncharacterized protein LOC134182894 isoform X1 [Corticium candelabrum]XP_062506329.1 uncharacterized protein LOC134182894 isoform X1 [Corticium candelabrum]XP_062506335.1 uncharacterized protein LOC134182894 isoform X1 [Corticium candelabrum]XP_062506341.1 uncharacterized protein LOC134182894 isoform X1 [Corticium candelabrum]XP_062506347.1 uncharacterized protein LOC134182894 isoform X1 [Corticium candelabrum]XP_062506353.1 uncharacterized protein LOC134182894 isoform X1 [Corticium candel
MFKSAGNIIAASIVQGGPGFPMFSSAFYAYLQTQDLDDVYALATPDDIPDSAVAHSAKQIGRQDISNEEFETHVTVLQDSVIAAGYPYRLTKENHGEAVRSLLVHEIILSRRSEIDQVIAGLGPEICTMVKEHGKVMSSLFTNEGRVPLVASEFLKLVTYENTLPRHLKDYFQRYVLEADEKHLRLLLQSVSGVSAVPPMGFQTPDSITVSSIRSRYPDCSTCAMILELPINCTLYDEFSDALRTATELQSMGFGIMVDFS